MHTPEEFERVLRDALGREAAPPDFAAKVLAKVRQGRVVKIHWWQRRSALLALAAAIAVAAVVPPVWVEHRRQERAVEAHRQLVLAMQITRAKIIATRQKIRRNHS